MIINLFKCLTLWLFISCSWFVHAQQILKGSMLVTCHHQSLSELPAPPQPKKTDTENIIELKNINKKTMLTDKKVTCTVNAATDLPLTSRSALSNPKFKKTNEGSGLEKNAQTEAVQIEATPTKTEDELKFVEKELEQERLKVLFVDVNSVVENVGSTMDWTANYLDSFFAKDDSGKNKAKTWGHFVLGWEPKEGEVFTDGSFPIKFKIKAKLPNLENKVEVILSDGEDDDFKTLPYESVRPEAFKISQSSLGAAVRFLHTKSDNVSTSARIGWGENQLYTRTSATYRKKLFDDKVILIIQPAIEYYVIDGWGARFLLDTGLKLDEKSELRYNFSLRDLESFHSSEWRSGLFHIKSVGDKAALITGLSSFGYIEPKVEPISHKFSIRYRFNALRSWLFFEIEPFVELNKYDPYESEYYDPLSNDFVRNRGISFRIETHYGFL